VRLTQGCFSFLPDLTDAQIEKQIAYAISKGWAMNVEWTDDPHPRNSYFFQMILEHYLQSRELYFLFTENLRKK